VVDDFLFDTLGWCDRSPAAWSCWHAVGRASPPGDQLHQGSGTRSAGRFVVRERDAHAWAEVWFPRDRLVTFDPTATPLAGTDEATPGADARDWREIGGAALVLVALVALVAGPVRRLVIRWRNRRRVLRSHRSAARNRWDVRAEDEIERRGRAAGIERDPGATLPRYAAEVAAAVQDPGVVDQAEQIERHRYGPTREPVDVG
jgi:hypothetical protein